MDPLPPPKFGHHLWMLPKLNYVNFFFHTDHHIVPNPQHCHMYYANMASRNWVCLGLWSPYAENLEVSESVYRWRYRNEQCSYTESLMRVL